jgi:hypothetical protein
MITTGKRKPMRRMVTLTLLTALAACAEGKVVRHPINRLEIDCASEALIVTNPTTEMTHDQYSCDDHGFVTRKHGSN